MQMHLKGRDAFSGSQRSTEATGPGQPDNLGTIPELAEGGDLDRYAKHARLWTSWTGRRTVSYVAVAAVLPIRYV